MSQRDWSPDHKARPAVDRGVAGAPPAVSVSLCALCRQPIKLRPDQAVGTRLHECTEGFYYMSVIGPALGYKS